MKPENSGDEPTPCGRPGPRRGAAQGNEPDSGSIATWEQASASVSRDNHLPVTGAPTMPPAVKTLGADDIGPLANDPTREAVDSAFRAGMASDRHVKTARLMKHLNSARRSRWRSVAEKRLNVSSRSPWTHFST